jgi:hypothetical protein
LFSKKTGSHFLIDGVQEIWRTITDDQTIMAADYFMCGKTPRELSIDIAASLLPCRENRAGIFPHPAVFPIVSLARAVKLACWTIAVFLYVPKALRFWG